MKKSKLNLYALIPDTHVPHHDKRAWALFLKVMRALNPYGLRILGDFGDFYAVSDHSKDPSRALKFEWEVQQINKALGELDALGAKDKHFVAGNHEDRLLRYLRGRAPELHNSISVPRLFKLKTRGWGYTPYKEDATLGKLNITHDVGSAGRTSVFKCLDTYQHSNVTGHTHRMAYIVEGNAKGEHKVSAQFGWLGDIEEMDYMHKVTAKKNWALGFGLGYHDTCTDFVYVVPVPIVHYTCMVNGVLYKG